MFLPTLPCPASPACRAGRLVEVAFAELDADPLGTLRRIYSGLSLPGFESVRPAFRRYCEGLELSGFKKNAHRLGAALQPAC